MKGIIDRERIKGAWSGRVSGCMLGKPVELISIFKGRAGVRSYLERTGAWPLRDYVPWSDDALVKLAGEKSCRGRMTRSEPDDDINYTVLALMMLEEYGAGLTTARVAHSWLRWLPAGQTFTAERAAYKKLLELTDDTAFLGIPPGLNLGPCADNAGNQLIGAQIRTDLYGWVCPGRPELASRLAREDARLSHVGDAVEAAAFIAALGAAIPVTGSVAEAMEEALKQIQADSGAAAAVEFGRSLAGRPDAVDRLHEKYAGYHPVHALNNLALVVWALLAGGDDFGTAVGEAVMAGWDTDCNGATVGGLWGLTGRPVPQSWTDPWQGRVAVMLAGVGGLTLEDLADRTVAAGEKLG